MEINNNGTIIKVYPSDESELTTGVMTSGKVVLHFRSDQDIKLEQGATIEFLGNTYTLVYPQETKKLWRGYLEYIATFYSSAEQLKHKLLKDPSNIARTSFVFAGSPTDFATLVARSMGHEWSVGNCVATSYDKTIAFKEESCWAALGRVAEEFHTEWVVEGKSISLRKDERYKEDPLPLSYGKGNGFLSGVSQRGNADNLPISRLYVLGSSRNIDPTKYGASTLHLPKSWSGEGMRTDEAGNYIELIEGNGAEGAMELSDLYPHRVGVVSSVVVANEAKHFYDIIDTSIPEELNYNDYRIRSEKAILKFETGALAGRQFEIRQSESALSGYHHQERRFELIPSEQDGFIMPSKEWAPKAGDKYAVFGIALPQEYVTRAENELLKEAIRTLSERSLPQFTFEGEVDGIWAKQKWLEIGGKLVPGGHVLFSDAEFHPEGTVIRITSMAQKVNNPTAPSITLSTALVGGSLWNVLNRAEAQEVLSQKRDRELQRSQRQSYEQALEHIGMVERAVEGVEGFSKRIKPSVIETMGLLVGSQATQLDFVERYGSLKSVPMAINYNPTDKRITISNAFIRHQTIGITSITNARKPTDYRYWSVARYTSPALTDTEQSYYIYAKVEREGKGGNYLLSPDPLPFETTTHYHLLIGTLSSVIDGDRAYNRLYGFSMVTPGQILTDTISSANGNMTIDLQNGSIISDQIEFRRPDGSTKSVEEVITDTVQVGGRNLLRQQDVLDTIANHIFVKFEQVKPQEGWNTYTLSFDYWIDKSDTAKKRRVSILGAKLRDEDITADNEWHRKEYTLQFPLDESKYPLKGWLTDYGSPGNRTQGMAKVRNVKLERGTVATDWTPAPEDVQAEIGEVTKKAYDDAVKKAEELDGQLQVGGRNLAVMSRMVPGYLYGDISEKDGVDSYGHKAGTAEYKTMEYGDFVYDPTYIEWNGDTPITYKIEYTPEGRTAMPIVHYYNSEKRFISWICDWSYKPAGYTKTIVPPKETAFIRIGFCTPKVRTKLERGTIATDWSPAPEDVQAEIDAINANPPRINQTTKNWEVYVPSQGKYVDTGRTSVGDDGKAPKIVDGYWYEWDSNKGQYTNTDIKARGVDGKDAVVSKVVMIDATGLDENMYYPIAITGAPNAVHNRYRVYTTLYRSNKPSWAQHTYGFQCELVWKCFNSEWGAYSLNMQVEVASWSWTNNDAPPMSQTGQITQRNVNYTCVRGGGKYYVELQAREQATLDKMTAELVTAKKDFGGGYYLEPQTSITAPITDLDKEAQARATAVQEINTGLTNANTLISTLDKAQKQLEKGVLTKADIKDIQYLLDSLKNGKTQVAGGLVLTNDIILSEPTTGQVMATISGTANTGANALRLGIQYPDSVALATLLDNGKVSFGSDVTTDEQREQSLLKQGYSVVYKFPNIRNWIVRSTASTGELTTLRNDGTGHIGQLHFDSDRIVVAPIGDISKAFMEFGRNVMKQTIQEVLQANAIDSTTKLQDVRVIEGEKATRTFEVLNDNTSVTIDMDLKIDEEEDVVHWDGTPPSGTGDADNSPKQLLVKMDDDRGLFAYAIEGWRDKGCIPETDFDKHGLRVWTCTKVIPPSTTSIHKTVILHQGTHTLTFYTNFGRGGANNIKVSQKYSTNYRQTSFSDRGMRIYGGGDSYVDFNHDHPQGTTFATIGGGLKVDYIDTPGVPLCGVMVRSSGTIDKSFGRYKNKWGAGQPQVDYDYSTKRYTVHHSIPHDHYIPTIQVTGYSGNNGSWSLAPRVFNISSYSFEVAIITNGDNYTQNGFSYTCFLTE